MLQHLIGQEAGNVVLIGETDMHAAICAHSHAAVLLELAPDIGVCNDSLGMLSHEHEELRALAPHADVEILAHHDGLHPASSTVGPLLAFMQRAWEVCQAANTALQQSCLQECSTDALTHSHQVAPLGSNASRAQQLKEQQSAPVGFIALIGGTAGIDPALAGPNELAVQRRGGVQGDAGL